LPVRRILVISVDGQSAPNPNWPRQRIVSGLGQIISAVKSTQVGAYNIETLIAVQATVDDLVAHLRRLRCRQGPVIRDYACRDVAAKVLRISLSDYPARKPGRSSSRSAPASPCPASRSMNWWPPARL
jgi:NTE family protein